MMIYNAEQKYLHISIPRTGSTQLNILINHLKHPEPDKHHMMLDEAVSRHPEAIADDVFKFTFVRHPLDRLVSLYFEFTKNRGRKYSAKVIRAEPLLCEFDRGDEVSSFRNFATRFPHSTWVNDIFFRPQHEFIESHQCKISFVGRFERLEDDWLDISERVLGRRISAADRRTETHRETRPRSSSHKPYMEYYDAESLASASKFYEKDFEVFNYE